MPYITVDKERVYYTGGSRSGRPLLLAIHGAGGDHRHWPEHLRNLSTADCMLVDLPGHGKSKGSGRKSVDAYADFIESLVAALQLDKLTLAGHSMGGAILLTLALRQRPWLGSIILVGTGAKLRVAADLLRLLDEDYPKAVNLICSRAFAAAISGELMTQFREGLLRTSSEVTRNDFLACERFDVMEKIGAIRIPALIVSGSADEMTPPKYGSYLQEKIQGASHRIVAGAGHMLALEKPAAFIEAVTSFMT